MTSHGVTTLLREGASSFMARQETDPTALPGEEPEDEDEEEQAE